MRGVYGECRFVCSILMHRRRLRSLQLNIVLGIFRSRPRTRKYVRSIVPDHRESFVELISARVAQADAQVDYWNIDLRRWPTSGRVVDGMQPFYDPNSLWQLCKVRL